MAFTKHASFEQAEVLELKGSPVRRATASLDKLSDFDEYRTDDGYLYARIRAISSRVNKNNDGWPSIELAGSPEIFEKHARQSSTGFTVEAADGNKEYGFATFLGKPIFVDHNNSDPKRTRGAIVDAKLKVVSLDRISKHDKYYSSGDVDPQHLPPTEVELLLEIDAKKFPKLAKAIRNGDIDGFSMGCDVVYSVCSHCGNKAESPEEYCSHIVMKGAHHDYKTADGKRISRKSYENCYKIKFFEISAVFDPADETALAKEIRAGIEKEAVLENGFGIDVEGDPVRPWNWDEYHELVNTMVEKGISRNVAEEAAVRKLDDQKLHDPIYGEGGSYGEIPFQPHLPDYDQRVDRSGLPVGIPSRKPVMNDPFMSSTHTAENPLPNSFHTKAPENVDTTREEQKCPICGNDMDGETCKVCGYDKPPEGFGNPDLQKAQQIEEEMKEKDMAAAGQGGAPETGPQGMQEGIEGPGVQNQPGSFLQQKTRNQGPTASVMSEMRWEPKLDPRVAARINQHEQPVRTTSKPATNEPVKETVTKDQTKPVTSSVTPTMRTAQQLIAAAQNKTGDTMSTKTADGPTGPAAAPDTRTDVTGVGGVIEDSNEEASRADSQVTVTDIGGTGVDSVEADSTTSLPTAGEGSDDSGFNKDKNIEAIPTKTYDDSDGTEKGITDTVTRESLEGNQNKDSAAHQSYDSEPFPNDEIEGGSANKGTQPVDEVGKAGDRVDVLKAVTSPENNSGPTKTWSGTDGNKIYRQQDPVTNEVVWNNTDSAWTSHFLAALKVADKEVELGLISQDDKYNRLSELSAQTDDVISNTDETLSKVKTAGLERLAAARTAGVTSLPRAFGRRTAAPEGAFGKTFERVAVDTHEEPEILDEEALDSQLFTR